MRLSITKNYFSHGGNMKRSFKFTALLVAMLMIITSFAAVTLAEGETGDPAVDNSTLEGDESSKVDPSVSEDPSVSGDPSTSTDPGVTPDPNAFNINIVIEGAGADSANVYFNGSIVSGSYTGTESPIAVQVEPMAGYKVVSAVFDYGVAQAGLTEVDGKFSGTTLTLSAGITYSLRIVTEAVPVPAALTVETMGVIGYTVLVDGSIVDLSSTQIMTGSEIKIEFSVDGTFDASLATLTHNGEAKTAETNSYTFIISGDTKIVYTYGVVPVTVTLNGPGKLDFQKTLDSSPVDSLVNNATGVVTKTLYLTKGESYKIIVSAALGYELSGMVEISETDRTVDANGVYFFRPSGATTVKATMKASQGGVTPNNCTVQINVGMGGKVQAGGQTVLGGMGTNIVLGNGESLTFTVIPDDGYVVDVFRVGGSAVVLSGNTYTLSNIVASTTTVSVLFKSNTQTPVTGDGIGVADIDWSASPITVDISGGKLVKHEVFEKIATLGGSGLYVEFRSENGTVYIPYGGNVEGSAATANLAVTPLTSGALYDIINTAINAASGGAVYKAYSFNFGVTVPEGTMVSFKLGSEFVGSSAVMLLYNSATGGFFTKESASQPLATLPDGTSDKYAYDNEGILVLSKESLGGISINSSALNDGGAINPEGTANVDSGSSKTYYITAQEGFVIKQILVDGAPIEGVEGLKIYNYTFENITENHTITVEFTADEHVDEDESSGGITTVIVILIIVLVAVAGAAALFIVKWRQEKF